MWRQGPVITLSGTSPNAASTTAIVATSDPTVVDFSRADAIRCYADLIGATGGTLDTYLQYKLQTNLWSDFCQFGQLAAGAGATTFAAATLALKASRIDGPATVVKDTDAAVGTQIPIGIAIKVISGGLGTIRVVCVSGTGTTVGALVKVYLVPYYLSGGVGARGF